MGRCGSDCGRNEIVGLSFKFGIDTTNVRGRVRVRVWASLVGAFAHAPALQEFGNMLTRRTRNRIQIRNGKRICACWRVDLVVCVGVRVFAYMCNSVLECTNAWVTDPLAQPLSSDIIQS